MKRPIVSPAISALARKYRLTLLYLFGSAARGDTHQGSDVDMAYLAARPLSASQRAILCQELRALLKVAGREIDLVDLKETPPLLGYLIVAEGQKLYGSNAQEDALYRQTHKRYIDAKPLLRLTQEYVHSQINI